MLICSLLLDCLVKCDCLLPDSMLSEVGHVLTLCSPSLVCCCLPCSHGGYLSYTSCVVHKLFTTSSDRLDVIVTEDLSITLTSGTDWLERGSHTFTIRLLALHSEILVNDMTLLMRHTLDAADPSLLFQAFPLIPCMTLKMACFTHHPRCIDLSLCPVIATAYSCRVCVALVCKWSVLTLWRSHNVVVIMSADCT